MITDIISKQAREIAHDHTAACKKQNGNSGRHGKACDRLTEKILKLALDSYDAGFEASGRLTIK